MPPRSGRRKKLPRGWGVSFTAIEVCIENAERLLVDATKTSAPTAAGLAELSIEEAAKAWMLFFRFMAQGRSIRNLPRASRAVLAEMENVARSHEDDLSNLDDRILEAFRDHRVKLRFVGFLLEEIQASLPLLTKQEDLTRIRQDLAGPAVNAGPLDAAKEIEMINQLISSFRLEGVTYLDVFKKRGFYVNLGVRGDLITPGVYSSPARLLAELAAFLILSLKGNLLLASHELSPSRKAPARSAPTASAARAQMASLDGPAAPNRRENR